MARLRRGRPVNRPGGGRAVGKGAEHNCVIGLAWRKVNPRRSASGRCGGATFGKVAQPAWLAAEGVMGMWSAVVNRLAVTYNGRDPEYVEFRVECFAQLMNHGFRHVTSLD